MYTSCCTHITYIHLLRRCEQVIQVAQLASSRDPNNFTGGMAAFPSTFVTSLVGVFASFYQKLRSTHQLNFAVKYAPVKEPNHGGDLHPFLEPIVLFGAEIR